ncbi:MAG: CotH kinase family protein [Proteobacteria bacterium]|nr:CotH kinase family protein [Pseudomonadota bacterium]
MCLCHTSTEKVKGRLDPFFAEVIATAFNTDTIQAIYDTYSALVEPYATTEISGYSFLSNPDEFYQAINQLKEHTSARATAVDAYLPE